MKPISFLLVFTFAIIASASPKSHIYVCEDERDSSLKTLLYLSQNWGRTSAAKTVNAVEIYRNNKMVDSERGRFIPSGCVDEQQGAIGAQCEIEYYPVGSRQSAGVLINYGSHGRILMQLADRQFRGNCYSK